MSIENLTHEKKGCQSLFSIHFLLPCYCPANQMPALNMLLGPFIS